MIAINLHVILIFKALRLTQLAFMPLASTSLYAFDLLWVIYLLVRCTPLYGFFFQEMTPDADIISTRYTKSVIKSCAALSYVEAQAKMDDRCFHLHFFFI